MVQRLLGTSAAAALLLASSLPAGAQSPPMWDTWRGFYLGANVGGAFGDSTATTTTFTNTTLTSNPKGDSSGFLGGVQGGYNWRVSPRWIVGVEADFDGSGYSTHSGLQTRNIGAATLSGTVSRQQDWLGTVRGRVGYNLAPNWLHYITAGFAYGDVNLSGAGTVSGPVTASFRANTSGVETGWTVGSGFEVAVSPQISLKAEYLYVDLGNLSTGRTVASSGAVSTVRSNFSVDNNEHIIRVGMNYHFNAPPPAPPPMPVAAPPPPAPKVFIVFFDWDRDTVTPDGMQIIHQAADAYKSGAPVQIQVTGYTDRSGSPGYNQRLSERRANNVARALAGLGVPRTQMAVSGRGENDNRVPTADGVREPQNRRVEIVAP